MLKVMLMLLLIPISAFCQNKTVWDSRTNQQLETWRQQGNQTYVTDPTNNDLLYTRYRQGSRVYIRDTSNYEWATEDHDD